MKGYNESKFKLKEFYILASSLITFTIILTFVSMHFYSEDHIVESMESDLAIDADKLQGVEKVGEIDKFSSNENEIEFSIDGKNLEVQLDMPAKEPDDFVIYHSSTIGFDSYYAVIGNKAYIAKEIKE